MKLLSIPDNAVNMLWLTEDNSTGISVDPMNLASIISGE